MDCHTQRWALSLPKQREKSRRVCSPCSQCGLVLLDVSFLRSSRHATAEREDRRSDALLLDCLHNTNFCSDPEGAHA